MEQRPTDKNCKPAGRGAEPRGQVPTKEVAGPRRDLEPKYLKLREDWEPNYLDMYRKAEGRPSIRRWGAILEKTKSRL